MGVYPMNNIGNTALKNIMRSLATCLAEECELAHKRACEAKRIREEQPLTYRTAWGTFHGS